MKDDLGDRMKENYESRSQFKLIRRMPVIIRLDGKAFHTFTKGFDKPFDEALCEAMADTTKYLCENIQGCVLGYTQSDEITLVLVDYQNLNSEAWFDYKVQKLCSVSASMTTLCFNENLKYYSEEYYDPFDNDDYNKAYHDFITGKTHAYFDSRCFNIPKEEVTNCLIWRQKDATRNSISSVGQYYFSPKELNGKSSSDIQDMLMKEKQVNWNDLPIKYKRGICCIKTENGWEKDYQIPIFTQDRNYIERLINFENE